MADDKLDLPERYKVLKSGAVYDREVGRIVSHSGEGEYQITSATARAMLAKKREKAIAAQMRGLAAKNGIALPPDATDEEVLNGALDGMEALTAHMKKVFLESNNIRGLAEAYTKLTAPLVGSQSDEREIPDHLVEAKAKELLHGLSAMAKRIREEQIANGGVIDAEVE